MKRVMMMNALVMVWLMTGVIVCAKDEVRVQADERESWEKIYRDANDSTKPLKDRLEALKIAEVPEGHKNDHKSLIKYLEHDSGVKEWEDKRERRQKDKEERIAFSQPAASSPLRKITCTRESRSPDGGMESFTPDFGALIYYTVVRGVIYHEIGHLNSYPQIRYHNDPREGEHGIIALISKYLSSDCVRSVWHRPEMAAATYEWLKEKVYPQLTTHLERKVARLLLDDLAETCESTKYDEIASKVLADDHHYDVVGDVDRTAAFCYRRWRDAGGLKGGNAGVKLMVSYVRRVAKDLESSPPKAPAPETAKN